MLVTMVLSGGGEIFEKTEIQKKHLSIPFDLKID
jgi:hypothetical protein